MPSRLQGEVQSGGEANGRAKHAGLVQQYGTGCRFPVITSKAWSPTRWYQQDGAGDRAPRAVTRGNTGPQLVLRSHLRYPSSEVLEASTSAVKRGQVRYDSVKGTTWRVLYQNALEGEKPQASMFRSGCGSGSRGLRFPSGGLAAVEGALEKSWQASPLSHSLFLPSLAPALGSLAPLRPVASALLPHNEVTCKSQGNVNS